MKIFSRPPIISIFFSIFRTMLYLFSFCFESNGLFKFLHFDLRFVISDPEKNARVQNPESIARKVKCTA